MEEDNQKTPSCPDFVIPPEDPPFDVYKISQLKDKLFTLPSKGRSNSIKQWVDGLKEGSLKRDFGVDFSFIKALLKHGTWVHQDVFFIAMSIFMILLLED